MLRAYLISTEVMLREAIAFMQVWTFSSCLMLLMVRCGAFSRESWWGERLSHGWVESSSPLS